MHKYRQNIIVVVPTEFFANISGTKEGWGIRERKQLFRMLISTCLTYLKVIETRVENVIIRQFFANITKIKPVRCLYVEKEFVQSVDFYDIGWLHVSRESHCFLKQSPSKLDSRLQNISHYPDTMTMIRLIRISFALINSFEVYVEYTRHVVKKICIYYWSKI